MSELKREPGESLADFLKRRRETLGLDAIPSAGPTGTTEYGQGPTQGPVAPDPLPVASHPWDADLIPDIAEDERVSEERLAIDAAIAPVNIVDAYNRWCHKMHADPKGKRESIMVSCPFPGHQDEHPSAWVGLDKGDGGVGNCPMCGGFDKYDIAAWHFGFPVPEYKTSMFPELLRRMAEDLGYRVMQQGKAEWVEWNEKPTEDVKHPAPTLAISEPESNATFDPTGAPPSGAEYDWRDLPSLAPNTFLREWMETMKNSYEPEEYYLWLGLAMIGIALGNETTLKEKPDIRGNMMMCLVGGTGCGKSIAIHHAETLVRQAMPWDTQTGHGVRLVASPGSGEALIDLMSHTIDDPTGSGTKITVPVRGLYRENELSSFIRKAGRSGSVIREIMMDMFDRSTPVSTYSRMHGTASATDHFLTAWTSVQPDALGGLITHQDAVSGFLNRWIYVYGKAKHRPAFSDEDDISVDHLVDMLKTIRSWATLKRRIRLTEDAKAAFTEFFDSTIREIVWPEDPNDEAPLVQRLPVLAKKLVLLFAANCGRDYATEDDVRSVAIIWPAVLESYELVAGKVSMNLLGDCQEKIVAYMRVRPSASFTIREIRSQSSARRYTKDGDLITRAIQGLVALGEIEEVPRARTDGRAAIRYRYVSDGVESTGNVVAFPGKSG